MSANHSLVLVEGDVVDSLPEVFDCFGLRMTGNAEVAKGLAEIWDLTNWPRRGKPRNLVHKAVLFNGTWTAILDREMNMILSEEQCAACADRLKTRVFGYIAESISGTAGIFLFAPCKVRALNIQNNEVVENFGDPLPQEDGISLAHMMDDGPMWVSRRLGFSDALFAHPTSRVLIVGMEDPVRSATVAAGTSTYVTGIVNKPPKKAAPPPPPPTDRREKPWWKLW